VRNHGMLRLIEIMAQAGLVLFVILSSNAAAEMAKDRLGKAFPFAIFAGTIFSFIAGLALLIFVWERVLGYPEINVKANLPWIGIVVFTAINLYIFHRASHGQLEIGPPKTSSQYKEEGAKRQPWAELPTNVMLLGGGTFVYWLIFQLPEPPRGGWVAYYFGESVVVILLAFALMVVVVVSSIVGVLIGGLGIIGLMIFEFRTNRQKTTDDDVTSN